MPTANEMPYFRITADTFGASPDRYGALSHIIEPFFQNPNYQECELDSSFFDHAADDDGFDDKLCQLIDIQSSVKILEKDGILHYLCRQVYIPSLSSRNDKQLCNFIKAYLKLIDRVFLEMKII